MHFKSGDVESVRWYNLFMMIHPEITVIIRIWSPHVQTLFSGIEVNIIEVETYSVAADTTTSGYIKSKCITLSSNVINVKGLVGK